MSSIEGFDENERKGLLGKVVVYLDNANMSEYEPNDMGIHTITSKKDQLRKYFTDKELKLLLGKIQECDEKRIIDYFNLFKNSLTDANIQKIWQYLNDWRNKYWNGQNMDMFLCGFLGKLRENRSTAINKASKSMYDKNIPVELIRMTGEYLNEKDRNALNKGGKKRIQKKTIRRKNNKRKNTKRRKSYGK